LPPKLDEVSLGAKLRNPDMSLARTVARNSLWSGLDTLVEMFLPPIMSIIVARAMGPAKLGAFSYVMWLATSATTLAATGISWSGNKFLAEYAGQHRPEVFRAFVRVTFRVQVVMQSFLSLLGLCWANLFLPPDERVFGSLAMLSVLPGGLMFLATAINNAVQELRPNVIASISAGLVHSTGLLLTVLLDWGLVGLAGSLLASRTCDCTLRWMLTLKRLPGYLKAMGDDPTPPGEKPRLPPKLAREVTVFAVESTILTLMTLVVWNRSEMFFLKRYSAIEQVAYFSVAFGLGLLPGQIVGPFSRAAGVSVYAERGRDPNAGLRVAQLYFRYMVLLVIPACLGLSILSGPLLRVLYGARYFDAVPVLMIAAALGMFASLANPANSLITAAGGQRRLVIAGLGAAVVTLSLDYFLVRAYAAVGGALANGLGQAISAVLNFLIAYRYNFKIPGKYLLRATLASVAMAAVVAGATIMLSDIAAIVIGPVVGAFAYAAFLRVARIIQEEDVERLLKAASILPGPLKGPFRRLVYGVAAPPSR
jgi:O-antigen/teichoic acid export membrane protein